MISERGGAAIAEPPRSAYGIEGAVAMQIERALPVVRRGTYALAALTAWLPLAAIFDVPISLVARCAIVLLALLSVVRPQAALLIVAAFVTIADLAAGQPWFRSGALRAPETLILVFLGGWLLSNAVRPRATAPPPRLLQAAAAIFACLIAASMMVAIAPLQAQSTFPGEYASRFGQFLAMSYIKVGDPGDFGSLVQGAWLLEGLALLFAVRALRLRHPAWGDACVRMLIVGAAAAGTLTIERFVRALLTQPDTAYVIRKVLNGEWRLPAHVADVNAAGTGFIMGALLALGYLTGNWRRAVAWTIPLLLVLSGLLISASRSAIAGGLLVMLAFAAMSLRRRAGRRLKIAGMSLMVAVALIAAAIVTFVPNLMVGSQAVASLKFRWSFAQTSVRIISLAPVFGVGVGRYRELSPIYTSPDVPRGFRADNAHNYFLQVAAELGLVGLIAFTIIVWTPVMRGVRALGRGDMDPPFAGIVGAAAVFLITSLTGHPFLIPAINFPFWILLGLCAAEGDERLAATAAATSSPTRTPFAHPAIATTIALAAIALTVPQRIRAELRHINFANVAYGVYDWEESQTGFRFRWTGPRARFFVPNSARLVEIPVRALHFNPSQRETTVDITLDGRPANHLVLSDAEWRQVRLLMPQGASQRFRRIDLSISPTWSPAELSSDSGDSRRLGVIVGEINVVKLPD